MPFLMPISACLVLLVGLGLLERHWRNRSWKAVPIRIHVNGTRGKSSVTRLIWAALRAAGIPTLAKTTGAVPRLLLPDGTERPLRRRGKPNIREQLRILWLARRIKARAVVLECMAIAPELQWTAEQDMMRATIGVITNARTDHTEVMGHTWDEIAASLANTIPRGSVLVVGDQRLATAYERCAAERGSQILVADTRALPAEPLHGEAGAAGLPSGGQPWQRENQAIALAVTRQLGIADAVALAAMRALRPGAGDTFQGTTQCGPSALPYLDARKANDPESFLQVWRAFLGGLSPGKAPTQQPLLIYNHRSDRPHRLLSFAAKAFRQSGASEVWVTGQRPAYTLLLRLRCMGMMQPCGRGVSPKRPGLDGDGRLGEACLPKLPSLRFVSARQLPALLAERAGRYPGIVFCGNMHGLDLTRVLQTPNMET